MIDAEEWPQACWTVTTSQPSAIKPEAKWWPLPKRLDPAVYQDVTTDQCLAWLASAGFDGRSHHPNGVPRRSRSYWPGPRREALIPASVSSNLPFVTTYAADAWAALADPTRREIFSRLAVRPRSVADLASELPVSRPAVSQHLRVLKDADLVRVRAVGTRRIYAVDPEGLRAMRAELESFWSAALTNFKRLAETEPQETE